MERPRQILLVEDEPMVAFMLQDLLEGAGYAVIAVHGDADARKILATRPSEIAALVTDISIGAGGDGWALAQHARSVIADLAVVYTSGSVKPDHGKRGVPHSVYLPKPFNSAQLIASLSPLLASDSVSR